MNQEQETLTNDELTVGTRVGAILGENKDGKVEFLGYGTYEGVEIPSDLAAGPIAMMMRMLQHENPKIKLDNGDTVYGCECWWGTEKEVEESMKGRNVINVKIETARQEFRDFVAKAEAEMDNTQGACEVPTKGDTNV